MTAQLPPFYKDVVVLSKSQHKNLYVEPIVSFSFANKTNSIFITASEFPRVACEYPIVFARDKQGSLFPVVLLGLRREQNLYVTRDGKWAAEYVPAYARRYPFILAMPGEKQSQFAVCIDRAYAGFNTDKKGQPLFDESGEETDYLKRAVEFLKSYQNLVNVTNAFCQSLVSLELLEPMQAKFELESGDTYSISGFDCVSRAKLKALPTEKLTDLFNSDQLELIYLHLNSLIKLNTLQARLNAAERSAP